MTGLKCGIYKRVLLLHPSSNQTETQIKDLIRTYVNYNAINLHWEVLDITLLSPDEKKELREYMLAWFQDNYAQTDTGDAIRQQNNIKEKLILLGLPETEIVLPEQLQTGGADIKNMYYAKYLKYKTKYLALKKIKARRLNP